MTFSGSFLDAPTLEVAPSPPLPQSAGRSLHSPFEAVAGGLTTDHEAVSSEGLGHPALLGAQPAHSRCSAGAGHVNDSRHRGGEDAGVRFSWEGLQGGRRKGPELLLDCPSPRLARELFSLWQVGGHDALSALGVLETSQPWARELGTMSGWRGSGLWRGLAGRAWDGEGGRGRAGQVRAALLQTQE